LIALWGARRRSAVHPATSVGHCRRLAGRALAGLRAASGRLLAFPVPIEGTVRHFSYRFRQHAGSDLMHGIFLIPRFVFGGQKLMNFLLVSSPVTSQRDQTLNFFISRATPAREADEFLRRGAFADCAGMPRRAGRKDFACFPIVKSWVIVCHN
jgi:hypothetical protein